MTLRDFFRLGLTSVKKNQEAPMEPPVFLCLSIVAVSCYASLVTDNNSTSGTCGTRIAGQRTDS